MGQLQIYSMRPPRKPGPKTKTHNSALKKPTDVFRHPAADFGETDTSSSAEEGMATDEQGFRSPAPDTEGTDYGLEYTDTGSRYLPILSKVHCSVPAATNKDKPNESNISKVIYATSANENQSSSNQTGTIAEKPLETAKKPLGQGEPGHVVQSKPTEAKTHKRKTRRERDFLKSRAKLMARTDLMIPRAPFGRIVREIMLSADTDVKSITVKALEALHVASEAYVEGRFEDANLLALHARRVTVMARDLELINFLRSKS